MTFFIGSAIFFFVLFNFCARSAFIRFLSAAILGPMTGIVGFAAIVFFGQVFGIGFFERIDWMSWEIFTHPISIAMSLFFFVGLLNPRLYGQR